jgi:hypothetical protein
VNTAYQEVVVVAMAVVAVAKSLYVLPDGPTALGHPTNEDLFVGTPDPGSRDHFVACIPVLQGRPSTGLPLIGR